MPGATLDPNKYAHVKLRMSSSTTWSVPTVREIRVSSSPSRMGTDRCTARNIMLAGIDGYKKGWIAAIELRPGETLVGAYPDFKSILDDGTLRLIVIDTPIGLLDHGARTCDVEARLRRITGARMDIVDAYACLWTARRIAQGKAVSLTAETEMDSKGLKAKIIA